jgi:sulfate adenylyltransferase
MNQLVPPHGGRLIDLVTDGERAEALRVDSIDLPSITLGQRQICDLELLMNGAFSPLTGFLSRADYDAVVTRARLADGTLWPVPVTLDIARPSAERIAPGDRVALRDGEGFMLAVLHVEDVWEPDRKAEAEGVFGTTSTEHPGVQRLLEESGEVYVGGRIEGVQLPAHFDFEALWHTPAELRQQFGRSGWRNVIAFQTSRPMHRLQRDIVLEVARRAHGHVLLHPTVGVTKPGDLHYYARVHCYQAILRHFPRHLAALSLLPLAMRMAGPREALWHGIIHQNHGCGGFIIGPDDGSPPDRQARFYGTYEAQEFVSAHAAELSIVPLPVEEHRYVPARRRFMPVSAIDGATEEAVTFADEELRRTLFRDREVPSWFSFPDVIEQLARVYPPRSRQGFTLFFTGLSGSGKSTLARIIYAKLIEDGKRPVTLLDGDIVRQNLSSELGFSKAHRDLNIRRIGFVANEITKNGGVAICAPIAPYRETRRSVRALVEQHGAFIEIYMATPLEVCEARDRKGLYAKARKGIIPEFTGVSDPYDEPHNPEIRLDATDMSPMEAAQAILLYLFGEGYLDNGDTGIDQAPD